MWDNFAHPLRGNKSNAGIPERKLMILLSLFVSWHQDKESIRVDFLRCSKYVPSAMNVPAPRRVTKKPSENN
ncbi:hypothetical protein BK784_04075 [Bacillus thuringiensis serovar medellin]|uniref:Uncharacterized protein n=1 Tax=Bacillus thuringiensis subsp. medellin TaxID=79672 RepID=A0A9X6RIK8_BACTV|nr:hypothetical protein BK784_04075 [Bacillus thuringiensis serovar medellin]